MCGTVGVYLFSGVILRRMCLRAFQTSPSTPDGVRPSLCLYEINHRTQAVSKDISRGSTEDLLGLEEVAARILFEAERPKFLMFERE